MCRDHFLRGYGDLLLAAAIFIVAAVVFRPLLDVIALSMTFAVVAMPLKRRLNRRFGPPLAAMATTITAFALLLILGLFVAGILYQNIDYFRDTVARLASVFGEIQAGGFEFLPFIQPETIWRGLDAGLAGGLEYLAAQVFAVPGFFLRAATFFLVLYLALLFGERVYAEIRQRLPDRLDYAVGEISARSVDTLYAIYIVEVIVAVITFFIAIPFFYFMGYDRTLFFAFITGVFQLVPIIGPSFIMVLFSLLAVLEGDIIRAVLLIAVGYPVVAAFPDAYIRPVLMGGHTGISPVILWIGIFGGLYVMGIFGFVFGPLILTWVITVYRILIEGREPVGR
ncbi:AI-2E family transporter [Methanoculleus sp. FWC-SCC3]|uniref:AI-2E family transporter n=1 Tax=Methanoculleus methanifontis TaxID=2584086 RepID=A0ABT8M3P3_9EURY|nr:AI-2E family transporter [Methanoculleus sp. FWC-SCC3]MDN7013007.1 AI-2E family transporter [Methanoculleus sp. FWC-SCC3]